MVSALMPHNLTEIIYSIILKLYIASILFSIDDNVGSSQQYMEVNEAGQQQTNDAAISYTNFNLQL